MTTATLRQRLEKPWVLAPAVIVIALAAILISNTSWWSDLGKVNVRYEVSGNSVRDTNYKTPTGSVSVRGAIGAQTFSFKHGATVTLGVHGDSVVTCMIYVDDKLVSTNSGRDAFCHADT
jgi:phosphate/sulfate permease